MASIKYKSQLADLPVILFCGYSALDRIVSKSDAVILKKTG